MAVAEQGNKVTINYTGSLEDGSVFDSSKERDPLEFVIGSGQVIVGFEEAVLGMEVGESKKVTLPPEKAYGERRDEMIIHAPKSQVPPDLDLEIGQHLEMGGPGGEIIRVVVTGLSDSEVILDANPPLAGKSLTFEIELMSIS